MKDSCAVKAVLSVVGAAVGCDGDAAIDPAQGSEDGGGALSPALTAAVENYQLRASSLLLSGAELLCGERTSLGPGGESEEEGRHLSTVAAFCLRGSL